VADPKPSLLERILATACERHAAGVAGNDCGGGQDLDRMMAWICPRRIRAAEEAEAAKPKVRHKWERTAKRWRCAKCDVPFSNHPGPCPGRTSTDATKGD
jgi:hypothetical protein